MRSPSARGFPVLPCSPTFGADAVFPNVVAVVVLNDDRNSLQWQKLQCSELHDASFQVFEHGTFKSALVNYCHRESPSELSYYYKQIEGLPSQGRGSRIYVDRS